MQNQELKFSFTGKGSEYFGIWMVNLLLTMLTFGIYSAWAKVRRMQYFYRNTHLNDASFDYHGTAIAILKGRLIAIALFATYSIVVEMMPLVGIAIALLIALIMPYLLVTSFRFRLYNTSYCGLRFSFVGSVKSAYITFLAWPVVTLFTAYLLAPFTHQRIKAYQHNNSRFGQSAFSFDGSVGSFYKIYLLTFLLAVLIIGLFIFGIYQLFGNEITNLPLESIMALVVGVVLLLTFTSMLVIPYFMSRIQNLVWNNTQLGEHRFSSTLSARGLTWITFSNFLLIIITLGLFKPFADIRAARYRVEHMAMLPAGNLEEFIASEQQQIGATGTETAEIFDVDIGF